MALIVQDLSSDIRMGSSRYASTLHYKTNSSGHGLDSKVHMNDRRSIHKLYRNKYLIHVSRSACKDDHHHIDKSCSGFQHTSFGLMGSPSYHVCRYEVCEGSIFLLLPEPVHDFRQCLQGFNYADPVALDSQLHSAPPRPLHMTSDKLSRVW